MKIEQEVGGSAENQDNYIGEPRQLTVDTDNWDIRLHDGLTPGGQRLINRDNGDERWQGKSIELDGFTFNPEQRGFPVRLGPGNYRIRQITVNGLQMSVTNPAGYAGNPYITLNERIETQHIFGSNLGVEGVLEVLSGIIGDTQGSHVGNVEGNLTGDTTGTHTGPSNGAHTGSHTGDLDVRGSAALFDANQIPQAAVNGLGDTISANSVRVGMILMWSGAELDIPNGWALCNGLNATPDLRNRFVVGAGSLDYEVGDIGGAATHTHASSIAIGGSHTHDFTVAEHILTEAQIPAHKHGNGVCDNIPDLYNHGTLPASPATGQAIESNGSSGTIEGYTTTVGGATGHSHTATMDPGGSHTHTLDNASASTLPPYYALCYIMRIA